jgi:antitoxin VapB
MIDIIGGSDMNTAKVFTTGRSQAIRLPKEFRFKEDEVGINRVGDLVVLFPRKKGWDVLAKALEAFTDDFMASRNQPPKPERRKAL